MRKIADAESRLICGYLNRFTAQTPSVLVLVGVAFLSGRAIGWCEGGLIDFVTNSKSLTQKQGQTSVLQY
jgi:hypothetical protein